MELRLYWQIVRRRWWIVVVVPLIVAMLSSIVALMQPARYGTTIRLLVNRSATFDGSAGFTAAGEDKTAQDLPAIVSSSAFRSDLVAVLARSGHPVDAAALTGALSASNHERVVQVSVSAAQPDTALAIAQATITLIQENGLRYWGDARATSANPGLDIGILDPPGPAVRLNGLRAVVLEVALRALLGLVAAIGLVFVLHAFTTSERVQTANTVASADRH